MAPVRDIRLWRLRLQAVEIIGVFTEDVPQLVISLVLLGKGRDSEGHQLSLSSDVGLLAIIQVAFSSLMILFKLTLRVSAGFLGMCSVVGGEDAQLQSFSMHALLANDSETPAAAQEKPLLDDDILGTDEGMPQER